MNMPCGHDESNRDITVESRTVFCRMCDLDDRRRDAECREKELHAEVKAIRDELARVTRENERLQRDMQSIVRGFRSHLGDIIRRIGPARRPDDIRASLEELHNSHNNWADHSADAQLAVAERDTMRARYEEAVVLLTELCGWDWTRLLVHHPDSDEVREQVQRADKWLESLKVKP